MPSPFYFLNPRILKQYSFLFAQILANQIYLPYYETHIMTKVYLEHFFNRFSKRPVNKFLSHIVGNVFFVRSNQGSFILRKLKWRKSRAQIVPKSLFGWVSRNHSHNSYQYFTTILPSVESLTSSILINHSLLSTRPKSEFRSAFMRSLCCKDVLDKLLSWFLRPACQSHKCKTCQMLDLA